MAPRRARSALTGLARQFPAHFAREEAIGYLAEALEKAPRFNAHAEVLRRQHAHLTAEIGQIAGLARSARTAAPSWDVVGARFTAFSEAVRAHEEAENEIMRSAFLEDLGSGD